MRIGIIVAEFPSYSETFFVNKIVGLCERGHEVILFRSGAHKDNFLEDLYGLRSLSNLTIVTLDLSKSLGSIIRLFIHYPFPFFRSIDLNYIKYKRKVFRNLCAACFRKYRCEIYHFGFSGIAITYLSVFDLLKAKKMVSCLGSAEKVMPLTIPRRKDNLKMLFHKADSIHCNSSDMVRTIMQYGAPEDKIYINRSAIDTGRFKRQREYADTDNLQILSIGRLFFQKGFTIGILAIKALQKSLPLFTWKIVGDGPDKEQLLFFIHSFGLENHVILTGKKTREEVITLYEESDIFFLPSVYEGIANVVLEAMSMELPVVSSLSGGMNEVITHNVNGMLCENYNDESMCAALLELCNDFEKRKQLGEMARKRIEAEFTLKRFIDVYENEYLKLLNN